MLSTRRLPIASRLYRLYKQLGSANGIVLFFVLFLANTLGKCLASDEKGGFYTNDFAVKISGGQQVALDIADRLGFEFITQIGNLQDYYLFKHSSVPLRSKRSAGDQRQEDLDDEQMVEWFKQQKALIRTKREIASSEASITEDITEDSSEASITEDTTDDSTALTFNDPLWKGQSYLHGLHSRTMNVIPVWNRNITGDGIVVTIIDDGIEYTHDDLKKNYDRIASADFNDKDDDPFPRYDSLDTNGHGTRCAGEVAMEANNNKCGVGVAFNAKIGGIRILDGIITDALEAQSIGHRNDYVDIYSASWGPPDDGTTVEGPDMLTFEALHHAIEKVKGRGGKGSIVVWASGNGGYVDDTCSCDGYASSVYTISISSVENGKPPEFNEKCSSTMASTASSSLPSKLKIATSDLRNSCTSSFTGTSASAPLAAGIIALAVEANPGLTWRDIQHIIAWTSNKDMVEVKGWVKNAAGLWFNNVVGFGVMDADAIVTMADPKKWQTVPEKSICIISARDSNFSPTMISNNKILTLGVPVDGCSGTINHVKYLEHVELFLNIEYPYRGALNINLTSSSGTVTTLLSSRQQDKSTEGFFYWPFVSLHTWGEEIPTGGTRMWSITVWDSMNLESVRYGSLVEWVLVLHGTQSIPAYRQLSKTSENTKSLWNKHSTFLDDPDDSREINARNTDGIKNRRSEAQKKWRYLHSLHRR